MAEDPEQMRARIEQQRGEITHTVDQIGNRVSPSHIVARRQDRMRRRFTDWRDLVFGNDQPDYRRRDDDRYRFPANPDSDSGMRDRAGEAASHATSAVQQAPSAVRRQTRGNPLAAGAVALGAGWLIGSLLPESRSERRSLQRMQPQLAEAAAEARDEARGLAEDLREPTRQAADNVKGAGSRAADEVKGKADESARNVRQGTGR
jgi:hypothetical protein